MFETEISKIKDEINSHMGKIKELRFKLNGYNKAVNDLVRAGIVPSVKKRSAKTNNELPSSLEGN